MYRQLVTLHFGDNPPERFHALVILRTRQNNGHNPQSSRLSLGFFEVKNQDIKIQGRYGTTQFTVDGQSALLELAISGPFINNDTIVIQPMSGTWVAK